jgi:hypothetical protein
MFMNVANFWDVAPCSPYVDRRFLGTYRFHLQGQKLAEQESSDFRLIPSSETSIHLRTTRRHIPEHSTQ